jgi:hypothetical protein
VSVLYDVDISFPRGVQKIERSQSNVEALVEKADVLGEDNSLVLILPPEPQALQEWHQKVVTTLPVVNEWALLDALGELLVGEFYDKTTYITGCPSGTNQRHPCVPVMLLTANATFKTSKLQPLLR